MTPYTLPLVLFAATLLLAPVAVAQADEPTQRTQRAQQTLHEMAALVDRSWASLQHLDQQRLKLQDSRLRTQYYHLWQLTEGLHEMARHTESALARYCSLLQDHDRTGSTSPELNQEMDRLLDHLQAMARGVEGAYRRTERLAAQYATSTETDSTASQ